jgi:hypothetical protein
MSIEHDEQPRDAAGMLDLMAESLTHADRRLSPDERVLYGTWGVAWLIAFVTRWATTGDNPVIEAEAAGVAVYAIAIAVAVIVTVVHIGARVHGVRGASMRAGQRWGLTWAAAFVALPFLLGGLDRAGATDDVMELLAPVLATLLVGIMYMAGGALWDDAIGYRTGVWIIAVSVVAVMFGTTEHYLVLGLGGGIGFLVSAVLCHRRRTTG